MLDTDTPSSAFSVLLDSFRLAAHSDREKGIYFEELIQSYLLNEASYREFYSDVWPYAEWAKLQGIAGRDAGIDLATKTQGANKYHAIQCKRYSEDYKLQKSDIDSFFTASGKKAFANRVIVSTTNRWSYNAEDALRDQQLPVRKIELFDLESSQIYWLRYQAKKPVVLNGTKTTFSHQVAATKSTLKGLKMADQGQLIRSAWTKCSVCVTTPLADARSSFSDFIRWCGRTWVSPLERQNRFAVQAQARVIESSPRNANPAESIPSYDHD
jgi:predicted helicase